MNNVASSLILFLYFIERSYKSLYLKACGVWVKYAFSLIKLNIWFLNLYLIASLDWRNGITALFDLSWEIKFFNNLILKSGLAASWIRIFFGLNFFKYFRAIKEESDLSLPPLITLIDLGYFFFFKWFRLFVTIIIFLKKIYSLLLYLVSHYLLDF